MATAPVTGKPLIESDRVEGTTVYDPAGNNIGRRIAEGTACSMRRTNERSVTSTSMCLPFPD